jgi:N-acetylglucosaminyldiphosphoundecaprenol N-acetyl-beta-D-mannosaminyltransferase
MKRVLDIFFVIPSMMFYFPPLALSLLIPGVRLLKKRRIGRNGNVFEEYRLRCPLTKFGRGLEKTSFHRFPALWNILVGQMSFIGPRALREEEPLPPEGLNHPRFSIRPGYIDPWWVRVRSNMTFDDPFAIDAAYAKSVRFKTDAGVFLRAILASLYGKDENAVYFDKLSLLGMRIDNTTTADAIARIDQAIREKTPLRISFVNADSLNKAFTDAGFHEVINSSDLVLGDGIGIKLGTKLTNQAIVENVNGTDLFPRLCSHMSPHHQRLYLLGAEEGIPQRVRAWVEENHPGVQVVGTRNGFFQPSENDAVCREIRDSQADVLLVAQGAPRQETWIHDNLDSLGVSVAIGVGGLFDFYSGKTARAPVWMREAGIEWTYRLIQEPRRMFKRYLLGNVVFIFRVLRYGKRN